MGDEYQRLQPNELIPVNIAAADNNVTAVSTITRRSKQRLIPISGSSMTVSANSGAGQQLSFNLASNDAFVDPKSAYVGFTITQTTTSGTPVLESGVFSVFQRAQLKVAGVMVEDIVAANHKVELDLLTECPRSLYDSNVSSLCGHWKYDNICSTSGSVGVGSYSDTKTTGLDAAVAVMNSAEGAGVRTYYLPLSMLFGLFNQEKYIPLFLTGTVEIDLQLNTISNSMFENTNATGVSITYALTNINLYYDAIQCIREVNQSYISAFQSAEGVIMPYNTCTAVNRSYNGSAIGSISTSVTLNLATPFLTGIKMGQVVAAGQQDFKLPKHAYIRRGTTSVYYVIGSELAPAYGRNLTAVDSLHHTICGYSGFNKTDGNLIRYDAWMRDAIPTGTANLVQQFVPSYNFCKNIGSSISMDGVNISAVGSTLAVYLDGANTVDYSNTNILLLAFLYYTRFLKLATGAVSVMY